MPYIKELEDADIETTRAARDPETGKTVCVDGALTYEKWYNEYVDRAEVSPPAKQGTPKAKDSLMDGLPAITAIRTNDDVKGFAEKFIDKLGIDRTNIQVDVKSILDNGYCRLAGNAPRDVIRYNAYVLNADDARSMPYRVKTAFHEAFHLSANGMQWDGLDYNGALKPQWIDMEETFTESAAHYLLARYGVAGRLSPSYPDKIALNLPRLKRLDRYAKCDTIQDFGKIAFDDRRKGVPPQWGGIYKEMENVWLPKDYYAQYHSYMKEHKEELIDMLLTNMPGLARYRSAMLDDLRRAIEQNGEALSENERVIYYGVLSSAMQMIGVK